MALYRIWKIAKEVDIDIIGGGGIFDYRDALEFFVAGSKAISIGTVNFVYPNAAKDIVLGMYKYMERKGIKRIGKLSIKNGAQ